MAHFNVLKEYYVRYLINVRGSSESTVNHYLGALKTISKYLVEHSKLEESIYEVNDVIQLEVLRKYLYAQPDFVEKDERGNRMYSAGLNNYLRFALGEDFSEFGNLRNKMDMEVKLPDKSAIKVLHWNRNGIIKKQSVEMAGYICEMNSGHHTFISASSGKQYMEGHHAIPLNKQDSFRVSLDVYANIVCLCPICHRLLHYGVESDKKAFLNKIYNERSERLANSGIRLSKEEFESIAI